MRVGLFAALLALLSTAGCSNQNQPPAPKTPVAARPAEDKPPAVTPEVSSPPGEIVQSNQQPAAEVQPFDPSDPFDAPAPKQPAGAAVAPPGKTVQQLTNEARQKAQQGDYAGAVALLAEAVQREPNNRTLLRDYGAVLQQHGNRTIDSGNPDVGYPILIESAQALRKFRNAGPALTPQERSLLSTALYNEACAYGVAGDVPKGLAALRDALESGFKDLALVQKDADLESLRSDPQFKALVEEFSAKFDAEGPSEIQSLKEPRRQWTIATAEGSRKIDAELVGLKAGTASFQEAGGKSLEVPLDQLTQEDRRAVLTDRVGSGVVAINAIDPFGQLKGFGSGFIVHANGLVLTNYHVIAGAGSLQVTFRDQKEPVTAEVLAVDRPHDVAFLRVPYVPDGLHVVEMHSSELPLAGSSVWTLGHPRGLKNTVGWGEVNAVRQTADLPDQMRGALSAPAESRWVQTNAVLSQGSSGGPLLNDLGQAIGVNTFVLGPQLGFAIHISHARDAYAETRTATPLALPLPPGDKEDPLAWPSREILPMLTAYTQEYNALTKGFSQLQQDTAQTRLSEIRTKYRQQFLEQARKAPQGWPGLQALAYAAQFCEGDENTKELDEICRLAMEHHAGSRHLSGITRALLTQPTQAAYDFCRRAKEDSPHEEVRLGVCTQLAMSLAQWLAAPDTVELAEIQKRRQEADDIVAFLEAESKKGDSSIAGQQGQQIVEFLRLQLASNQVGMKAPEITGVDIEGKPFTLSEYQGKVVLLDFFADWCPHCRRMYPSERALVEKMKDRPFALLGIHCESQQVLDELVKKKTVTWRSWADGQEGPIAQAWEIDGYPTMVLIDHQGHVRWRSGGVPEEVELAKLVEQLTAEAEKSKNSGQ